MGVPHFRQSHNMGTWSWGPEDDFLPDMASHVSVQGCNGGIYQPSWGASRGLGERPFLGTIAEVRNSLVYLGTLIPHLVFGCSSSFFFAPTVLRQEGRLSGDDVKPWAAMKKGARSCELLHFVFMLVTVSHQWSVDSVDSQGRSYGSYGLDQLCGPIAATGLSTVPRDRIFFDSTNHRHRCGSPSGECSPDGWFVHCSASIQLNKFNSWQAT